MMIIQWTFLVLTLVQIQATTGTCMYPDVDFCEFIKCERGRCEKNATITDCYQCICDSGFTGLLCDTAITTPSGCNPGCQNGGQCEQTGANTFACVCPPEFTGSQCETFINATHPCMTMPATVCKNGGTCTMNGNGYLCSCPTGWNGTNCDKQEIVTQCEANTCGGHGTCIQAIAPNGPIVICSCESQWTGKFCDINLSDPCPFGYCLSGGTCVAIGSNLTCQCPPTHTGMRCETLIGGITPTMNTTTTTSTTMTTATSTSVTQIPGNCSSRPCMNGGSCYNTGNSFVCLCTQSWKGQTCAIPINGTGMTTTPSTDACSPNPCSNGGRCYKQGVVGFVCICTSDFTGPTCTMPKTTTTTSVTPDPSIITCVNQPCRNGGSCYNNGNSYFCFCGSKSMFTGKNCETPISSLSVDCPLNCSPGRCVRTGSNQNAYACMCNDVLNPTSCSTN